MEENVHGLQIIKKHLHMFKVIYFFIVVITILSCQHKISKKGGDKQKFEYVHLLPDSLLNSSQLELKHKLQMILIESVVIKDNKFVLTTSKKDFMDMGIPVEYYKLLKKNMKDNNDFIRDNKIEDVSGLYDITIKQMKKSMNMK